MRDIAKILCLEHKENSNIIITWFLYLIEPEEQKLVMLEIFKFLFLYRYK